MERTDEERRSVGRLGVGDKDDDDDDDYDYDSQTKMYANFASPVTKQYDTGGL